MTGVLIPWSLYNFVAGDNFLPFINPMNQDHTCNKIPRILVAGTGSGCGKTTIACAIMQAFVNRGLKTGAFKCGPDYIDPMFHEKIIGKPGYNLDAFFCKEDMLRCLLVRHGAGNDVNVIEGVMGYYDGTGSELDQDGTYDISKKTDSPVVLVIGAKGASASVLAVLQGFLTYRMDARICGVILNQCTAMTWQVLSRKIEKEFQGRVKPLGYMPPLPDCSLESRHLGLITADEVVDLMGKLQILAGQAESSIHLDELLQIARSACPVCTEDDPAGLQRRKEKDEVRIAVARDRAFCFYYEDNLELLRDMGARIVPFSPLKESSLPENIHGLYLGGGYPELYLQTLCDNVSMRTSIHNLLMEGLPCIAECGGFMYLTKAVQTQDPGLAAGWRDYPMAGVIDGVCHNAGRLQRFGYVTLTANQDNMLCKKGEQIRAHEFHYWDSDSTGHGFTASKLSGKSWDCVHVSDHLYAGFPHFHFYANPSFAQNFYEACRKWRDKCERSRVS